MTTNLFLDFETRSAVDIKKVGAYLYASDPSTEVLCCAFSEDGKEPSILYAENFAYLYTIVLDSEILHAHNAQFERLILKEKLGIHVPINEWRCTAAKAAAMGLPRDLGSACAALGLPVQKDDEGRKLMLKMCKPRNPKKGEEENKLYWHEDMGDFARLSQYCIQDVRAEMALDAALPDLIPSEQALWELNEEMNDLGLPLDKAGIRDLLVLVKEQERILEERLKDITLGEVETGSQVARILSFLECFGLNLPDLTAQTIEDTLPHVSGIAREVLLIRQELGRGSVAKLKAMISCSNMDARARGSLLFHGTETGRWAGRLVQPQNMPRGDMKPGEVAEAIFDAGQTSRESFLARYGSIHPVVSSCLRGLICAPEGKEFLTADYSNIEGRINAFLSGEDWKVQAFKDFDSGIGPDLYNLAYSKSFGVPLSAVGDWERQIGKVQELALGYQGGPAAYYKMAGGYGVKVPENERAPSIAAARLALQQKADKEKKKVTREPTEEEIYLAWAKPIVYGWREQNPAIVASWAGLEGAAYRTVETGKPQGYRSALFGLSSTGFLRLRLPSGRMLSYYKPEIRECLTPWEEKRKVVTVMGVDPVTRQWSRSAFYGGKWCNALVQGTARDIMAYAMLKLQDANFEIVLTVHDEIMVELDESDKRDSLFKQIILEVPPWIAGLPMAIKTWRGRRYRK